MTDRASRATELRQEVDRLRREIQGLRIELAEERSQAASVTGALTPLARTVVSRARTLLRPPSRSTVTTPGSVAAPYVVRVRDPTSSVRARVLHVIANFHLGGSARLVVDLAERLARAYEHSVVAADLPPTPAYVGIPVAHHPATSLEEALAVLRRERPAFVHVHYLAHHRDKYGARSWEWYRHWFGAAESLGIPVLENINIPTEPFVSDAVACYVHVSDYVRERFGRLDGRHVTIYPGSDFTMFRPPEANNEAAGCLGMVYRLQRDKLDERAMEPFIEAIRLRPSTRALIVGDGVLRAQFERRVVDAGMEHAFTFTGSVPYDALPALYRQMGVFVAPVHRESFGQVTPFAMGMGLPVVGYDVGAIPEIVGDDSVLAETGDARALAERAVALLDNPSRRAALGAANRARAERMFSVEAMISAYEPLYAELVTRGARLAPGAP